MILLLVWLATDPVSAPEPVFAPGDHIWVGRGMAEGYGLDFGRKLTILKVRVLFMKEARMVFAEIPGRRYYMRTDFGPFYAFREDPEHSERYTPEEWETIRRGEITVGMSKDLFLHIRPRTQEINVIRHPEGTIEQWIYRENPRDLYGTRAENPPTEVYYFQNEVLIEIL